MSYPGTSHLETEACRACTGEFDPAALTDGLCPECGAGAYRRNQL